jgi:RND family efflux transporter MFP subunit
MLSAKGFKYNAILFVISVFLLVSVISCTNQSNTNNPTEKHVPVTIMPIAKSSIESSSEYTGLVKPKELAYAVTAIPGKVSSSFFEVGDRVSKGDLLFTIESTEIEDGIRVLEEQLKVAEANLSMAKTGVVSAIGSSYESQKLQLKTALKSAEDNYTAAKEAFDAATLLMEAKLINRLKYNQIKNQFQQSKNALEASIEAYELYESKISKDTQSAANEQLKQAQASCDMLRLQIESARKKLEYTYVTSPIDGIIASKDIVTGCLISNTAVPYTIMDADTIQVVISVTEQVINKVKKGDKLNISLSSIDAGHFTGVVTTVSPAVDPKTLTYSINIEIANKGNIIKPGMTAKVDILTEYHENSIVVPHCAILKDDGGSFAFIVENNRAVKRSVSTGISNKDQIEILGGLDAGELLVVKGQQFLNQNDPVTISGEVS